MAKMSILEMTQDILSDMESDEVNSINDTVEALQVANIIKSTYTSIIDSKEWPWLNTLFKLESSTDSTKPTHMKIPENIIQVKNIKYDIAKSTDIKTKYTELSYKTPEEFLNIVDIRDSSVTNILVVNDETPLNIHNHISPTYYTSFDDKYIVFDSYDSTVDNILQSSKTKCFGTRSGTLTFLDDTIPDLPVQMFSYLLNEAKSTCFSVIKQMANNKAEQHSISQRRRQSQDSWRLKRGIVYPDYGRKRGINDGHNQW